MGFVWLFEYMMEVSGHQAKIHYYSDKSHHMIRMVFMCATSKPFTSENGKKNDPIL